MFLYFKVSKYKDKKNMGLHTFLRQYRHYVYLVIMIFRKITKSQSQNHKINYGSIMLFLYVIIYHYILLFINKVLYYIRIPFLHVENPFCDFVIVIVWLIWLIELYPIRQRSKKQIILSYRSSFFICLSICNTSYYRAICNTCYPSTSKN